MTDKKLHFPSMDDLGDDLFIENDRGEYERFIPDDFDDWDLDDETGDNESGGEEPNVSILAGEKEAYEKAMELTAEEDDFQYFPRDGDEENNRKFAMKHLQEEWGLDTNRNIGVARFFLGNFLEKNLIREAHVTGIGSHPFMILAFYKAAHQMEQLAGSRGGETRVMKFKGMNRVRLKKLEEKARDLACRTYLQAKNEIIRRHGGIHHV